MSDKMILTAEHITKKFPASGKRVLTACDDINLTLCQGETLGIVGESGYLCENDRQYPEAYGRKNFV